MKGRVLVLGTDAAALMVDGRLEDVLVGPGGSNAMPSVGNICVVRIARKLPQGGAFCEMAGGEQGFMREAKGLAQGSVVLAQVASLPEPGKAVTISSRILYKGAYLIHTPGASGINLSRQIRKPEERERLQKIADGLDVPDGGLIVRTGAIGAEAAAISDELKALLARRAACEAALAAGNVWCGDDGHPVRVALRDWMTPRPDQVIAGEGLAEGALIEADPFEAGGVWDALDEVRGIEVALPSAGSMAIEATRALVAVDVNTGRDFSPAAAAKANREAVAELPRQLRIRGLGGQIAVDFAPLPKKARRDMEAALRAAFGRDAVETSLVGWSGLGMYELQRKRERRPVAPFVAAQG